MATRFTKSDKEQICEYICEKWDSRKNERRHLEAEWKEIDRQLRMEPAAPVRRAMEGTQEAQRSWTPETELPLQAQCLEITSADARRMMFGRPWFKANAALTDDYLNKVDFQSMITGDTNDVPSKIDQDNADSMCVGLVNHWHRQYDFFGNMDYINADAIKYGLGVGRLRTVQKRVFMSTERGIVKSTQKIPVLVPRSIKHVYPDNSRHRLQNEGFIINPGYIFEKTQLAKDLKMEVAAGADGYVKNALKDLDDESEVTIVEWEGDLVVSRKTTGSLHLPNALVSVAISGTKGQMQKTLYRIRQNNMDGCSYIEFPYHVEHIDSPYATSPLMKGRPIQAAATFALVKLMEAADLNTEPPIGYDGEDPAFITKGGPRVHPGAKWATTGEIKVYDIGDPAGMLNVYSGLLQQYSDVTGVNAPRLGAQTVSHTTAFAKEAELNRGQIRTADYVNSSLEGPLTRYLDLAYRVGRKTMGETTFFIDNYGGYVTVKRDWMPKDVQFQALGSVGPQEELQKRQERFQAAQQALQIDQLGIQLGNPPKIDTGALIEQIMLQAGWTDLEKFIKEDQNMNMQPEPNPGSVVAAQQALAFPR